MAGQGWLLSILAAAVCLSGAIVAVQPEVQDFQFDDSDGEVKLVLKRAAEGEGVVWDDEDFLADEASPGVDEGSGELPPTAAPDFTSSKY
ncbi:hypothetical protein PoB_007171400 [Plakobranchus ocellatus]|uniref:Uncharacterized protein n=1 Tax=Plakobranchus ocellatus TaxID=259542 RepID=A0AAV4DMJ6_9GAST|nr:hypothetical protein PoB_007171400 [Plakobranchus ocellatus]